MNSAIDKLKSSMDKDLLSMDESISVDAVVSRIDKLKVLAGIVRDFRQETEAAVCRWIDANGDIEVGDTRWYVGKTTSRKCKDVPASIQTLIEVLGGDLESLAKCLTSQPLKPAYCRSILKEKGADAAYTELFTEEAVPDLKTGKPKRGLRQSNSRLQ